MRKLFFFFLKGCRVNAAAAAAQLDRMTQVQHLVIHEIFDGVARDTRTIKDAADDNGVVSWIVVAQVIAGMAAAPRHLRTGHQAMKEPEVQVVEDLFQIIVQALGPKEALAATHLPDQASLGSHAGAAGKFAKTRGMLAINFFTVKLGNKYVKDGVEHRLRGPFQQIREAHQNAS